MYWEKEIRIRLSKRRIFGGILATMSVVNLIIVGAVYNATTPALTSTPTSTQTTTPPVEYTITPSPKVFVTPSPTPTNTKTQTPSPTPKHSPTLTATSTYPPSPTQCTPRTYWPAYVIQRDDTLFSLAPISCSTVAELMLANCLYDDHIYAGQILYVPCMPIKPPTITPWKTPTETEPPSTETNHPPTVRITIPSSDTSYNHDGYDKKMGLFYTSVLLQGYATDPEDGVLLGSSLEWTTDRTDIHGNPILGIGNEVKAILLSTTQYGALHTITLTAIDKDGNFSTATRSIFIYSEY